MAYPWSRWRVGVRIFDSDYNKTGTIIHVDTADRCVVITVQWAGGGISAFRPTENTHNIWARVPMSRVTEYR